MRSITPPASASENSRSASNPSSNFFFSSPAKRGRWLARIFARDGGGASHAAPLFLPCIRGGALFLFFPCAAGLRRDAAFFSSPAQRGYGGAPPSFSPLRSGGGVSRELFARPGGGLKRLGTQLFDSAPNRPARSAARESPANCWTGYR